MDIKSFAQQLQKNFKNKNIPAKHSDILHAIASVKGYANWNAYQSVLPLKTYEEYEQDMGYLLLKTNFTHEEFEKHISDTYKNNIIQDCIHGNGMHLIKFKATPNNIHNIYNLTLWLIARYENKIETISYKTAFNNWKIDYRNNDEHYLIDLFTLTVSKNLKVNKVVSSETLKKLGDIYEIYRHGITAFQKDKFLKKLKNKYNDFFKTEINDEYWQKLANIEMNKNFNGTKVDDGFDDNPNMAMQLYIHSNDDNVFGFEAIPELIIQNQNDKKSLLPNYTSFFVNLDKFMKDNHKVSILQNIAEVYGCQNWNDLLSKMPEIIFNETVFKNMVLYGITSDEKDFLSNLDKGTKKLDYISSKKYVLFQSKPKTIFDNLSLKESLILSYLKNKDNFESFKTKILLEKEKHRKFSKQNFIVNLIHYLIEFMNKNNTYHISMNFEDEFFMLGKDGTKYYFPINKEISQDIQKVLADCANFKTVKYLGTDVYDKVLFICELLTGNTHHSLTISNGSELEKIVAEKTANKQKFNILKKFIENTEEEPSEEIHDMIKKLIV